MIETNEEKLIVEAKEEEEFRVQFDPKINARKPQDAEELQIETPQKQLQKLYGSTKEIDDGW